jgi:3-hydroxyisobutyrate dehydrogenase-like beta-hydroxyacid dehydrogenase
MTMNFIAQDQRKLGFIGIGAMGLRIAVRLLKHGFHVTAFDRDIAKANALILSGGTDETLLD